MLPLHSKVSHSTLTNRIYIREKGQAVVLNLNNGALAELTNPELNAITQKKYNTVPGFTELFCSTSRSKEVNPKSLIITIETSYLCNLSCTYCYQNDKGARKTMNPLVVDATKQYIQNTLKQHSFDFIVFNFIGGEPLLGYEVIESFCNFARNHFSVPFYVHVDTNGCFDLSRLLKVAPRLFINICLSHPDDHNVHRYSAGHDTTGRILNNLRNISPNNEQKVTVAYNSHKGNIDQFEDFLLWLNSQEIRTINTIDVYKIDEYDYNRSLFNTGLTNEEFLAWKYQVAYPLLVKHHWKDCSSLSYSKTNSCQGHDPFSCKIYADGAVTICDAMRNDQSPVTIFQIANQPQYINKIFSDIKPTLSDLIPITAKNVGTSPKKLWCGETQCAQTSWDEHILRVDSLITSTYKDITDITWLV